MKVGRKASIGKNTKKTLGEYGSVIGQLIICKVT